ncbi:MAG: metalloregulator ArsR/SmtB family transcription factor [Calditrichia bacterium]|nr:helix-turn-helix transcriptional regulator [Calditrichota bacterium]MCB0268006.1 helix-turn-helix transcriptional regulator [Calditrichota bacterium]MCB0285235.1 helix-turn-helix transcriptional regulator [Calditrichota bacterium]MCB9066311.1 helix-turn-helix transcriptional regulator [Calditrichia bacterium]
MLTTDKLDAAAEMLKAIAHPTRIAIINLLENSNRLTVTEIFESLSIEQAVASHHLRILRDRGVLNSEKDGKNRFYYLKHDRLSQIIECIDKCTT